MSIISEATTANGSVISIAMPQLHEAAEIVHFLNQVGGETDFLTFGLNEFPLSIQEEEQCIAACQTSNVCLMLIARVDNELASQLFVQRSTKSRLMHNGEISITVKQKFYGQSIGTRMMLTAIAWARTNSITKLQLQVRTDNVRAIGLYKKLGFIIEGEISRSLKIGNEYFSDYVMGLIVK